MRPARRRPISWPVFWTPPGVSRPDSCARTDVAVEQSQVGGDATAPQPTPEAGHVCPVCGRPDGRSSPGAE